MKIIPLADGGHFYQPESEADVQHLNSLIQKGVLTPHTPTAQQANKPPAEFDFIAYFYPKDPEGAKLYLRGEPKYAKVQNTTQEEPETEEPRQTLRDLID